MDKVSIVYVLGGTMHYGGIEAFIMNYYRHMNHDKVQIDFIYQGNEQGVYDNELINNGSKIYHVPYKSQHPIQFSKEMKKILEENDYEIIHSQMDAMGAWPLYIAKKMGVSVRIAHSHSTQHHTKNTLKIVINNFAKKMLQKVANVYMACGKDAGYFLFGDRLMKNGEVQIIHNAIELEEYKFDEIKRKAIREELRIEDEIVIGHVGRLSREKNHKFLLEVFAKLEREADRSCRLVFVGDGPLKDEIKKYAEALGVREKVSFLGARNDVKSILSAFDVFVMPSLYEGLCIAAIEAQCNGLPCVFSSTISDETVLTKLALQVGLDDSPVAWVQAILKAYEYGRKETCEEIQKAGYDINLEARKLEEQYLRFGKGK